MDKQRVDPTFRKMALATELFVSRPTFEHIQNLHPHHDCGWFCQKNAPKFAFILSLVARKSLFYNVV